MHKEQAMRTHRFGKKLKLPATTAIKHQLMKLMFDESIKEAEGMKIKAGTQAIRRSSEATS
jgi:hypothetical protein